MHTFILVGITGKIASGKSLIMNYLKNTGYKVFNSDEVVAALYTKSKIQKKIVELIGFSPIDKQGLANIIFGDDQKRKILESFIHPLVTKALEDFTKSLHKNEIGFAEIPLLFETNMEKLFNYVIVTYCNKNIRLERALNRGTQRDKFEMINKIQIDEALQKSRADFVVNSDVSLEILKKNIDEIIGKINERNNT